MTLNLSDSFSLFSLQPFVLVFQIEPIHGNSITRVDVIENPRVHPDTTMRSEFFDRLLIWNLSFLHFNGKRDVPFTCRLFFHGCTTEVASGTCTLGIAQRNLNKKQRRRTERFWVLTSVLTRLPSPARPARSVQADLITLAESSRKRVVTSKSVARNQPTARYNK